MVKAKEIIDAAPQYLGIAYSTMDCQAFVEKVLADAGIRKNLAGSNAWYRFALQNGWVGTPEECKKEFGSIPGGSFLFILNNDGKEPAKYRGDGIGNSSHIGIYTGQTQSEMLQEAFRAQGISATADRRALVSKAGHGDGAINSSATWGCVATSKFAGKSINGGWNRVWLWPVIDYGDKINTILGTGGGKGETMNATVVLPSGASGYSVNMRAKASTGAALIDRVPVGASVEVVSDEGQWCQIEYKGRTGWMMSNYLEYSGQGGESGLDTATLIIETALNQIDEQLEIIRSAIGKG